MEELAGDLHTCLQSFSEQQRLRWHLEQLQSTGYLSVLLYSCARHNPDLWWAYDTFFPCKQGSWHENLQFMVEMNNNLEAKVEDFEKKDKDYTSKWAADFSQETQANPTEIHGEEVEMTRPSESLRGVVDRLSRQLWAKLHPDKNPCCDMATLQRVESARE